jgi:hypothetical protein
MAPAWESWPGWASLEAGSAILRARLESEWGGITQLSHGQLDMLTDVTGMNEAFMVTFAALHDYIDATRPMRQLTLPGESGDVRWAIAFAAGATPSDKLPSICRTESPGPIRAHETSPGPWCPPCAAIDRPGDRAIVCGSSDAAEALRADFVARGLSATTGVIHAEAHYDGNPVPFRAVLDVHDDVGAGTLHATIRARSITPPTGWVSNGVLAAASRVQQSPWIGVGGPSTAYGLDLETPIGFGGFAIEGTTRAGHYYGWLGEQTLTFVEMTVDKLAAHIVPFWLKFQGGGWTTRVDPMPAPTDFPAGTRRFRRRQWVRDNGDIVACTPQRDVIGSCTVVEHRPPTTTLANDADFLLIPGDGGTWIAQAGDRGQVMAFLQILTSPSPAPPPTWTLPAVALGKQSTGRAQLFWAEHFRANGNLEFEFDGSIKP